MRNTVNARYEPENWQRIAQSIFDKLRQRKRDALVAYIMHKNGFERIEQLFEYFLIDPGMEPVVQISRIRLAISSVQLFIQRCLLNLELRVQPVAINSKHWQWMKRYRVWEANRKIFLFPENWLEPEFRDDQTNIFQELESALLQGDVSSDLVEDAFFNYLKKLEELAKLDIVTIYCEEKADDPASNTLHVIGRTSSHPHKYFYRRYAHQMWTPWEPVTAEIEGDHVVTVIWKQRLHLLWVTFLEKPKQDPATSRTLTNLASASVSAGIAKEVDIQLSWSQYHQGEWTTRESSGFGKPIHVDVANTFDKSKVFIFASTGSDDGSMMVNLGDPINRAFRLVSKNDPPKPMNDSETAQSVPYSNITRTHPTKFDGFGDLNVTVVTRIKTQDSKSTTDNLPLTQRIIQGIGGGKGSEANYSILPCITPFTLIDKIRTWCSWVTDGLQLYLPVFGPPPSTAIGIGNRLNVFAESLSLRLSDPSLGLMTAITNEWKEINSEIAALDILGTGILNPFLQIIDGLVQRA